MSYSLFWSPCAQCGCSGVGPRPPCVCGVSCGLCSLPKKNLDLTWNNTSIGPGSTVLTYDGTTWQSPCVNQIIYTIGCTDGAIDFRAYYSAGGGSCPNLGSDPFCSTVGSDPFSLSYSVSCTGSFRVQVNNNRSCPALALNGYTDWTVNDPDVYSVDNRICGCVTVLGCANIPLSGATVKVTPGDQTFQTNNDGFVCFTTPGVTGTYHLDISHPSERFIPLSVDLVADACFDIDETLFTLLPEDGYQCIGCCPIPISETLHGTIDFIDIHNDCNPNPVQDLTYVYDPSTFQWTANQAFFYEEFIDTGGGINCFGPFPLNLHFLNCLIEVEGGGYCDTINDFVFSCPLPFFESFMSTPCASPFRVALTISE